MLDSAFILILVLFGIKGFWAGDSREVRGMLSMALALFVAQYPSVEIGKDLHDAGLTPQFADTLAYALSAAVIFPISYLGLSLLGREINYFGSGIPFLKRCLGAAFSITKGLVLLILFSNLLLHIPLESRAIRQSRLLPVFALFETSLETQSLEPEGSQPSSSSGNQP